jgi:hypothetical protein
MASTFWFVAQLTLRSPVAASPQITPGVPKSSHRTPAYKVPPTTTGRVMMLLTSATAAGLGQAGAPVATSTPWISTWVSSVVCTPTRAVCPYTPTAEGITMLLRSVCFRTS